MWRRTVRRVDTYSSAVERDVVQRGKVSLPYRHQRFIERWLGLGGVPFHHDGAVDDVRLVTNRHSPEVILWIGCSEVVCTPWCIHSYAGASNRVMHGDGPIHDDSPVAIRCVTIDRVQE